MILLLNTGTNMILNQLYVLVDLSTNGMENGHSLLSAHHLIGNSGTNTTMSSECGDYDILKTQTIQKVILFAKSIKNGNLGFHSYKPFVRMLFK